MPINPIQFADGVCREFRRYLNSAFPLSDPELAQQFRRLLASPTGLELPLVKGPYVSLSEPFAQGEPVERLAEQGILHPAMPGLIGFPSMYLHQQRVFEAIKRGEHVLVATGTGSGKTEAFLYPIVDELLHQRDLGIGAGLAAVLVYPMNALANDQLDRLRRMLAGTGITFGQWVGTTPREPHDVSVERFEGSSRQAYLEALEQRAEEARRADRAVRPLAPPEECCSEKEILQRRPRVLITNYRQLEILTTRLPDVKLFAEAPLKWLVFDEAHTYEGAVGAEVACLIRRLRLLAGKRPDEVVCVGTSATLTDPDKETGDNEGAAKRFAARFFGVAPERINLIGEYYVRRQWPSERYKPAAPPGEGMQRLGRLLEALGEPVDAAALKAVVEELTGRMFEPGDDWRSALFEHLLGNEYVFQTTRVLTEPKLLDSAAWQVSQRLGPGRLPEGERATAELLAYLVLGAAAQRHGESLLRPKVHVFVRGLDEMVAALDGTPGEGKLALYMSLAQAKQTHALRRDSAFFSVLTCPTCGQHFLENYYVGLEYQKRAGGGLKGLAAGNAVEADSGRSNAVWAGGVEATGTRLLATNRLLEEAEGEEASAKRRKWIRGWFCRQCGALHREASERCWADGCGQAEPLLPLLVLGERLSSCPSCGSAGIRRGGREIEPARKVRAITVADVHILAQAMINGAPEDHKKLIVFADSRQDAAFQAGWMQDHARRIRLRHMMFDVIQRVGQGLTLDQVIDGLMERFRTDRSLVEVLLPELTGEEAEAVFGTNVLAATHRALRYMVLREFTTGVRRTDCLEAMGLVRVVYDGLGPANEYVRNWAERLGIAPEEAAEGIALLLDIWRRNRILFVANDPVFSRFHAKDDPYIQAGLLPLTNFRPEGLVERKQRGDRYSRGIIAQRGTSGVQALLKKWAADPESLDVEAAAAELWRLLTVHSGLLRKVTLRSQRGRPLQRDNWQVDASRVVVTTADSRQRCVVCQRVTARAAPGNACTRHHCRGRTVEEKPDEENYDVWLMRQPFVMVAAEEHTAQVPGEVRIRIEHEFKSKRGRTNCLVATPTLELGVDIGALDMALMRNVPPRPANYWQRAGRAGREERMAVVFTYCRRSPHDRYFFEDPLRLLGGAVEAPAFNLCNPLMVAKHIRSAVLSELLLKSTSSGRRAKQTREVLDRLFPLFIRDYLLDADDRFLDQPPSVAPLEALLHEMQEELSSRIVELFARHWPPEAQELAAPETVASCICETPHELSMVLKHLHRRLLWARRTRDELYETMRQRQADREERQLFRRCQHYIDSILRCSDTTYSLRVLAEEGFLPGYGVHEGGIVASASRGFAKHPGIQTFQLSRSSAVALREFVPGNRLYANRGTFYVARYQLGVEEKAGVRSLRVDPEKGHVAEASATAAYGQSGGLKIDALPLTDLDLAHESRITEEEHLRFSMPVIILGRLRRLNRGGRAYKIGDWEVHHLRGQGVELVNVGEAGQVRKGQLGYMICAVCGAAKTPYAVQAEIDHFRELHKQRCGKEPVLMVLSAEAEVDALEFHHMADQSEAINLGESLRLGAAKVLDMGEDDLQLLLVTKPDETLNMLIYDPMPGGSGLLEQMLARWREIVASARQLLAECPMECEAACYSCLKNFRNQFFHELLDRHMALDLMDRLNYQPAAYRNIEPICEEQPLAHGSPSNLQEAQLLRILAEHHFPLGQARQRIEIEDGLATVPDWFHPESKVAVYLDGMSRSVHGDPKRAQLDKVIREMLEQAGYQVIVIQSRDLDDPEVVRQHLCNIAEAMGREDLKP